MFSTGTLTINQSTINGNRAGRGGFGNDSAVSNGGSGGNGGHGGGVYATGMLVISGSTFSGNLAGAGSRGGDSDENAVGNGGQGGHGGGIYAAGTLQVTNSTISSNAAGAGGNGANGGGSGGAGGNGGGIHASANLTINNGTIYQNNAGAGGSAGLGGGGGVNGTIGVGGGLSNFGAATLNNSIVAGNTIGDDVAGGGTLLGSFNLVQDGSDGLTDTIVADPLLAALAHNGGLTQTHSLLPGSPAIDAGDTIQTVDQRGFMRPVDFDSIANATSGNGADIGAVEAQELPSFVVTTSQDVVAADGFTSLREAINLANSNPGADTITFASGTGEAFETGGVIRLAEALGELALTSDVTIDGASAGGTVILTGDTANDDMKVAGTAEITDAIANANTTDNVRVFNVMSGSANLNALTITGGVAVGATGGERSGGGVQVPFRRYAELE